MRGQLTALVLGGPEQAGQHRGGNAPVAFEGHKKIIGGRGLRRRDRRFGQDAICDGGMLGRRPGGPGFRLWRRQQTGKGGRLASDPGIENGLNLHQFFVQGGNGWLFRLFCYTGKPRFESFGKPGQRSDSALDACSSGVKFTPVLVKKARKRRQRRGAGNGPLGLVSGHDAVAEHPQVLTPVSQNP